MKARMRYWKMIIPLLLLFLSMTPAGAGILVQCPTDTDGDGISDQPDVLCLHLSSGDGFTKMADGKDQYIFSFAEIPPGLPIEEVVANFTGRAMFPAPTITVKQDQELYELLALVDAIRDGRARERRKAERILKKRILSNDVSGRNKH